MTRFPTVAKLSHPEKCRPLHKIHCVFKYVLHMVFFESCQDLCFGLLIIRLLQKCWKNCKRRDWMAFNSNLLQFFYFDAKKMALTRFLCLLYHLTYSSDNDSAIVFHYWTVYLIWINSLHKNWNIRISMNQISAVFRRFFGLRNFEHCLISLTPDVFGPRFL